MSEFGKALRKLIRKLQPVDYFAAYECKVLSQNADDGTLELEPLDDRLGDGLSHVEINAPAGYEKITVKPNARCMVSFKNGKPNAPYIEFFRLGDGFIEIALRADTIKLNGGELAVARKTDKIGTLTGTAPTGGGSVTFTLTAPDGSTQAGLAVVLSIAQGNDTVKA